ncbi:beta-glucosidase [Mycobacterium adipatum]|jgi:beta-N-acetylhexosaminidase|uniref:beta-N-acetylhexosaminidase n=1 Tax=Mycobacterium adipatum TaxID=1682113 RepID=A0A172UGB3_9MYCO|nr:glycoside hydrolase family 3 N-terminal domain-containing protein [Mycobacterium adipatum]ANE78108.1 beta-glucosidase [Mycobacterium adipatum]MBI5735820.1 glycoside hydrolase family 3 protein [Mycolicibacterium neoaurum]
MSISRALGALTALSGLLLACSPAGPQEAAAPPAPVSSGPAVPTNASFDHPLPAAPAPRSCDIATMSTRDKLAQLLMVGVSDAADARAVVADQHVGGIMIGSWTDKSMLGAPLADIAAQSGPLSLAVSVDEEGGRVSRLAGVIGSQPSARELAETKTPDEVYGIALQRGRAMRGLGITVDFAPVVDLTQESAAIGDRSFGDDPQTVTEYAGAYARGLRDAGVLPVLKHFPGHGRAAGDSHTGAVSTPPLAELQTSDLVPYRTLVNQPPVAVMVGHMAVPGLTGGEQASLSPAAYNLLRTEFGFGGVVYTDDLSSMAAINQQYGVAAAVLKSLQAGADIALWITTAEVPAVLDRLEQAVASGELSQGAVDASVQRVAASKGPNPNCGR